MQCDTREVGAILSTIQVAGDRAERGSFLGVLVTTASSRPTEMNNTIRSGLLGTIKRYGSGK